MAEDKQVLNGESSNASKGKQILEGESNNASEGESSNVSEGKQMLKGESSNATKGKQLLNAFKSLGLLPLKHINYSAAKDKVTEVYGNLFKNGYISKGDAGSTVHTTNHSTLDIELGDTVGIRSHSRTREARHESYKFWVISVVMEELSSQKNPIYALSGMVVSIITLILCIAELVWKGKKEKVTLKRRGKIYWCYDPNNKLFGSFPDIFGLVFGVLEFITATITYALYLRGKTNPIDLPFCSIVFAALLLCSKCPIDQDDDDPLIMETV